MSAPTAHAVSLGAWGGRDTSLWRRATGPSTIGEGSPFHGKELHPGSPYEAVGALASGAITQQEMDEVECCAIPGSGACGGMFTANTMSSSIEAMGMSLPGTASTVARRPPTATHLRQQKQKRKRKTPPRAAARLQTLHRPRTLRSQAADRSCLSMPRNQDGSNVLSPRKREEVKLTVKACFHLLRSGIRAHDIMTREERHPSPQPLGTRAP